MKDRTWLVLAFGFGSVALLTLLFGLDSWRRAGQIYASILEVHQSHARAEQALDEVESGIYRSAIFVRDYLLDPSGLSAGFQRQQLLSVRASMETQLATLHAAVNLDPSVTNRLQREINAYWDSFDAVFDWTPKQKSAMSVGFLRRRVLPRRGGILELAGNLRNLSAADLARRQKEMDLRMSRFRRSGQRSLALVLVLIIAASIASILRVSRLETRVRKHHKDALRAEQELRRLSRELVHAQEDERRNLSRELHDEIGQTLTALGVELGNLHKLRAGPEGAFGSHLDGAKQLVAQTLRSVRNIAAGLRPSILDDLGLGPALEWQAREFSRRTNIPVEVIVEGVQSDLPESHRTCLYRVFQEALTNCARHAHAKNIRVTLHANARRLSLAVQDDGQGMHQKFRRQRAGEAPHLGLVGIEERVRELGGSLGIDSQPGKGTVIRAWLPLAQSQEIAT